MQFGIVLNSLKDAGYNNYWKILNAMDYGIPQSRERVLIASIRKDVVTGIFEFPEAVELQKALCDLLDDEIPDSYFLMNQVYSPEGVAPTIKTVTGGGREVKILDRRHTAAQRGRYDENGKVRQRIEASDREYSNALTTVRKDALVSDGSDKMVAFV